MAELNSLNFDDDEDGVEVVEDAERSFDIVIADKEAEQIYTVGEFFDLVTAKLSRPQKPTSCFSAHVFYALRHALRDKWPEKDFSPTTMVMDFAGKRKNQELWNYIEASTGYQLPSLGLSPGLLFSLLVIVISLFVMAFDLMPGLWMILAGLLGYFIFSFDNGYLPFRRSATIREMVDATTVANFGKLTKELGGYRSDDAWNALVYIVTQYAGRELQSINRETVFFDHQLKEGPS